MCNKTCEPGKCKKKKNPEIASKLSLDLGRAKEQQYIIKWHLSEGFYYFKEPVDRFVRAVSLYSEILALEILGIPPGILMLQYHFLSPSC